MEYNFFSYFISATLIVFITIIGWFIYQIRQDKITSRNHNQTEPGSTKNVP